MDREAWQATVHGVGRVGQDLATKPPLLHSIGNYTQYLVITYNGKESEKLYVYIYSKNITYINIYGSFCCTSETNITF